MRLLILGGTVFLGRSVAEAALAAGDEVTLFTRGRTHPDAAPGARRLIGDRAGDLGALEQGEWDVVVDTSGFVPREVLASASLLAGRVGRYVFVSSASVYSQWAEVAGIAEDSPVHDCAPDAGPEAGHYGELKAGCERAVVQAIGPDASLIVRAGVLVGPHENVGRLPLWIERAARGGTLVAPGPPERPLQVLDARDLAAWMLEPGRAGTFNAVGRDATFGELVAALAPERVEWWTDEELVAAGVQPWTQLPFWLPEADDPGAMRLDGRRARISTRPLAETVADTRRWLLEERGREEMAGAPPARAGVLDVEITRAP